MTIEAWVDVGAMLRFDAMPIEDIHPDHQSEVLRLGSIALEKVLTCPRTRPRFTRLVNRRLGLLPCLSRHFEPAIHRLALQPAAALLAMALQAGAAWHGEALAALILAGPRRKVIGVIGHEAFDFALAHRHLGIEHEGPKPNDMLITAIRTDGAYCLEHWCAALPPALRARVRLKLPKAPRPMRRAASGMHRAEAIIEAIASSTCSQEAAHG